MEKAVDCLLRHDSTGSVSPLAALLFTVAFVVRRSIANALILGFGGAKWFKSENEKDILQKAAAIG